MPARSSTTTSNPPRLHPVDPLPGTRIRAARLRAGLTQKALAGDRYTGSYISALEKGLTRASMAALQYLAGRLSVPTDYFIRDEKPRWARMHADLLLASEDWPGAVDAYTTLLDGELLDIERALVRRGRAEAYCRLQQPGDALIDAAAAYPVLVAAGRQADAAYAAYWLAYAHYQLDNPGEARALIQQVLAEVRAGLSVQADFRLRLLVALASIERVEGRHRQALAYLEEGRLLAEELDARRRATFLFSLALSYSDVGDHEAALTTGTQALTLYDAASAEHEVAALENALALTHLELGNLGRAGSLATRARREAQRLGDERLHSHVLETEARIALAAGHVDEAVAQATATIDLAQSIAYPRSEADALLTRARAHRAAGHAAKAADDFGTAAELLRRNGPRSQLREVLRDWSELLVDDGRHAEAVVLLTEAVDADPVRPGPPPRQDR
jgi:transcriptional regulator with XRE-family HTH domain